MQKLETEWDIWIIDLVGSSRSVGPSDLENIFKVTEIFLNHAVGWGAYRDTQHQLKEATIERTVEVLEKCFGPEKAELLITKLHHGIESFVLMPSAASKTKRDASALTMNRFSPFKRKKRSS